MKKVKLTKSQLSNYVQQILSESVVQNSAIAPENVVEVYAPALFNSFREQIKLGIEGGGTAFGQEFESLCTMLAGNIGIDTPSDLNTSEGGNFEFADIKGKGSSGDVQAVLYSCKCSSKINVETMDAKISTLQKAVQKFYTDTTFNADPDKYVQPGLITGYPDLAITRAYEYLGFGLVVNVYEPNERAPKLRYVNNAHEVKSLGQNIQPVDYYGLPKTTNMTPEDKKKIKPGMTRRSSFKDIVFRGPLFAQIATDVFKAIINHFREDLKGKGQNAIVSAYQKDRRGVKQSLALGTAASEFEVKYTSGKDLLGKYKSGDIDIPTGDAALPTFNSANPSKANVLPLADKIEAAIRVHIRNPSQAFIAAWVAGLPTVIDMAQDSFDPDPSRSRSKRLALSAPKSYNIVLLPFPKTDSIETEADLVSRKKKYVNARLSVVEVLKLSAEKVGQLATAEAGYVNVDAPSQSDDKRKPLQTRRQVYRSGKDLKKYVLSTGWAGVLASIRRTTINNPVFADVDDDKVNQFFEEFEDAGIAIGALLAARSSDDAKRGAALSAFQYLGGVLQRVFPGEPELQQKIVMGLVFNTSEGVLDTLRRGYQSARSAVSNVAQTIKNLVQFVKNLMSILIDALESGSSIDDLISALRSFTMTVNSEVNSIEQGDSLYEAVVGDLMQALEKKQHK